MYVGVHNLDALNFLNFLFLTTWGTAPMKHP